MASMPLVLYLTRLWLLSDAALQCAAGSAEVKFVDTTDLNALSKAVVVVGRWQTHVLGVSL